MRVRFKKNSEIKNTIDWSDTPEGQLIEADVPDVYMMSAVRYVEHRRGNEWITPKNK
jgi:hypothetical protein